MKVASLLLTASLAACAPPLAVGGGSASGRPARGRASLEALVAERVDARRADHGLPALAVSGPLAAVGRRHSRDMARRGYFDHTGRDGRSPQDRARDAGVTCGADLGPGRRRVGVLENLYRTTRARSTASGAVTTTGDGPDREIADRVVDGWMSSPGHRRNLLDPTATAQGVGVARTDDAVLVTQLLC